MVVPPTVPPIVASTGAALVLEVVTGIVREHKLFLPRAPDCQVKVTFAPASPELLPAALNVAAQSLDDIVMSVSVTANDGNASSTLSFVAHTFALATRKLSVSEVATLSPDDARDTLE